MTSEPRADYQAPRAYADAALHLAHLAARIAFLADRGSRNAIRADMPRLIQQASKFLMVLETMPTATEG